MSFECSEMLMEHGCLRPHRFEGRSRFDRIAVPLLFNLCWTHSFVVIFDFLEKFRVRD
jgi:hypothetical protein